MIALVVVKACVISVSNCLTSHKITEQRAIDEIYDFAYDRFIGDDGETCEPEMDYAEIIEFKNDKNFVVQADLYISNIHFWACRYLDSDQGSFLLKFTYNEEYKRFSIREL